MVGTDGVNRIQVYSEDEQLLYVKPSNSPTGTRYIHLHNHIIAETTGSVVQYDHTDGSGSPVARTDGAGKLISRTRYEPYGATAAGESPVIGYGGHMNAADLGLVYMQQRYYDPVAGRFLSIDPVVAGANTGGSFNRYVYANNSPYRYIDPDGRFAFLIPLIPYVATATVAIVGHYVLPGREGREETAQQAVGNAIFSHGNSKGNSDSSAGGVSNGDRREGISSSLPKPPAGPRSVPKSERDPKRHFTPGEREAKRQEQGNKCGNGCGKDIDQSNSDGHHEVRHADGGRTTPDNHVEVCKECHKELHSSGE